VIAIWGEKQQSPLCGLLSVAALWIPCNCCFPGVPGMKQSTVHVAVSEKKKIYWTDFKHFEMC